MSLPPFRDRHDAGRRLADALARHAPPLHAPVILALPRGGVPVGWEVARALRAPLDVMVVRKLGVPGHEELAMGAIASGGIRVVSDEVVQALAIPARVLADTAVMEEDELLRREIINTGVIRSPDVRYYPVSIDRFIREILDQEFRD